MDKELYDYIQWFRSEFDRDPRADEFEADGFEFEEYCSFLYSDHYENSDCD